MIVIIQRDDVIDGVLRVSGEPVSVPSNYDPGNIRRIVATDAELEARVKRSERAVEEAEGQ